MNSTRTQLWKGVAFGGALMTGMLVFGGSAFAAGTPDAWITTKIKLALLTTAGVSSNQVNVDTIDGRVTLHGTVGSKQEKALAEKTARDIDGVKELRDMLEVVAPDKSAAVAAVDKGIKEKVEQALKADQALADSSVAVASVNNGSVLLSGTAASLSDHLTAVEVTHAVSGVRQVASEIESPNTLSDAEIWRDTKQPVAGPVANSTGAMSDMWITTAAKMRLIADSETPAMDINVDTTDGIVTLFGIVPTEASKSAAEADVAKVSGVQKVHNKLQVVAAPAQDAVKKNDGETKDRLTKRMGDAEMKNANLGMEVKDGVARMSGHVHSQSDRLQALTIARSTDGVRSVVDDIEVKID